MFGLIVSFLAGVFAGMAFLLICALFMGGMVRRGPEYE